jgi:hypothetical protein
VDACGDAGAGDAVRARRRVPPDVA